MKHSQEKILEALHIIQDVCLERNALCKTCPFRMGDTHCMITNDYPEDWNIVKEDTAWKAFE